MTSGCQPEYRDRDRWPMVLADLPPVGASLAWLSPLDPREIHVMSVADPTTATPPVRGAGWVSVITPFSDELMVFGLEGGVSIWGTQEPRWGTRRLAGAPQRVRAAVDIPEAEPRELLALICGGEAQPLPRETDSPDEPLPWLMGATVQLATYDFRHACLRVGKAELPSELNPWRIKLGRFAGEDNLLVFVYQRCPFDRVARRRPFIYRLIEGEDRMAHLEPRWRGTSFSHPFVDATFGDFTGDGQGEIAALEVGREGGRLLTAYRFEGFGLEGLAPSLEPPEVEDTLVTADVCGDGRDELLVHASSDVMAFIAYGLGTAEPTEMVEVARAPAPPALLAWVALPRGETAPCRIACLTAEGRIRFVELRPGQGATPPRNSTDSHPSRR